MSAMPSVLPEWATDGGADVVEPLLGVKQAGWVVDTQPPAGWMNWLFKTIYLWIVYLSELLTEDNEWTGKQTFNGGVEVGGTDQDVDFIGGGTSTVTFSNDGGVEFNTSVLFASSGTYCSNIFTTFGLVVEDFLNLPGEPSFTTPPTKHLHIGWMNGFHSYNGGLSQLVGFADAAGTAGVLFGIGGTANPGVMRSSFQVRVPAGATITALFVNSYRNAALSSYTISGQVRSKAYSGTQGYTVTEHCSGGGASITRNSTGEGANGTKWDALPLTASFQVPDDEGCVEVVLTTSSVNLANLAIVGLRAVYTIDHVGKPAI